MGKAAIGRGISRIRVSSRPGPRGNGRLQAGPLALRCALGPGGITRLKREGDGATPAGRFRILSALWRADKAARPRIAFPLRAIAPGDLWCDDPKSPLYNRPTRAPCGFGCETMTRADRLYDVVLILDHNQRPRVRGAGSAIFFHVAREGFSPTQGCVAIAPDAMRRLLPMLRRGATIEII